jgi:hypothetical protein
MPILCKVSFVFVISKKLNQDITNDYLYCDSIRLILYRLTIKGPTKYRATNYADKSSAGQ